MKCVDPETAEAQQQQAESEPIGSERGPAVGEEIETEGAPSASWGRTG